MEFSNRQQKELIFAFQSEIFARIGIRAPNLSALDYLPESDPDHRAKLMALFDCFLEMTTSGLHLPILAKFPRSLHSGQTIGGFDGDHSSKSSVRKRRRAGRCRNGLADFSSRQLDELLFAFDAGVCARVGVLGLSLSTMRKILEGPQTVDGIRLNLLFDTVLTMAEKMLVKKQIK